MIDFLALLGYRRAPRRRRGTDNGGWEDLPPLGGPILGARGKAAKYSDS